MENKLNEKSIYVTQPSIPPLEEFFPYLESIWHSKILTNCGEMHQKLEAALSKHLGVRHIALFTNGTIALLTALQALRVNGEVIIAESDELIGFGLHPVAEPDLPDVTEKNIVLGKGFYGLELDGDRSWSWALDHAELKVIRAYNPVPSERPSSDQLLSFDLVGRSRGNVWMSVDDSEFVQVLTANQDRSHVDLPVGKRSVKVSFRSDIEARPPGNGDARLMSFQVANPIIRAAH